MLQLAAPACGRSNPSRDTHQSRDREGAVK